MDEKEVPIWNICEEISRKKGWYEKVFDKLIVSKWREEVPYSSREIFDMALGLMKATAQGVVHSKYCEWYSDDACEDCLKKWPDMIRKDPTLFGLKESDLETLFDDECWYMDMDVLECPHNLCHCKSPDCSLGDYIVYVPDGVIDSEFHTYVKGVIFNLAKNESIIWHPDSKDQVRDIIHPSMYCYVKGVSKLMDGTVEPEVDESLRYQWLPSEFEISPSNTVKLTSYINNLDAEKYPLVVPMIEKLLEKFLPGLDQVLKLPFPLFKTHMDKYTPILKNIQVIVKIGQILLTPENPVYPGGSWHIEGMPYEHIAATCIHYLETDGMTESFLEFRKPTIIVDEGNLDYEQGNEKYTKHHYGITSHYDGVMNRYLGLIKCHEGASVIFPNTLQHRVKEFTLTDKTTPSTRTMIAFFVIDPNHRIISTRDIPPQQSIMSKKDAEFHQSRLMYQRKYMVDTITEHVFERPFSLCEH